MEHRAHEESPSELTQTDSSIETHTLGESIIITPMNIGNTDEIETSQGMTNFWKYCKMGLRHDRTVDYCPYHVASFFRKATCCVEISVGISLNLLLTAESPVDTGAGPKFSE